MQFFLFIILYITAATLGSSSQTSITSLTDPKSPLSQQPHAELMNIVFTSSSPKHSNPSSLIDFNTTSQDPNEVIGNNDDDNDEDDDKDEDDDPDESTKPTPDTNFNLMYYITGSSAALTFIGLSICLCYRSKIIEESGYNYTPVP